MATKAKEDVVEPVPAEEKPEVKEQTMAEVGQPAPKNDMIEELPPGHTYQDRLKAQAKARGIKVEKGMTEEMLLWRLQMAGGSALEPDEEEDDKADTKAKTSKATK